MSEHWGHAVVRLFMASSRDERPEYVGAYAEVRRGCQLELLRSLGDADLFRVEGDADQLKARDFAVVTERGPEQFDAVDPTTVPALRHLLEQVELARQIATRAHAGQTDKAGRPYIAHPQRVAARLTDLQAQAVAWLHDVLEDTNVTSEDLRIAGVDEDVIRVVDLLSRTGDDVDYSARIAADPLAREVKLADIADNTDPERTALLDPDTRDRLAEKYAHARRALGALEDDA
ncbi:HD domain-containing protein [Amnibacterium kyonggiense]|uniref:HD domain-containing protein n=1 Tax=Amnibacterium kyonggiense TaxID=595671 RepID=A0A4R7FLK1_9MICO|nr:HD domain-containing protein [Amnibacterium kyonggiense]TDS77256.1 HD domain-containing protein [Amnibacterium kyonggiense]